MTERLYYTDSYLREFHAQVVHRDGLKLYLDRTAFYPTSGGQLFDTGTIAGVAVVDVIDEGDLVAHVTSAPVEADRAECRIDWARRFDHMQQHTGQHLLSAVFAGMGFTTLSVHFGAASATLDLATVAVTPEQVLAAETLANELVCENRPVAVSFADPSEDLGLRKPSEREGTLRIVSIEGLDRSACGGTHVRATGEIGPILIRKLDKIRSSVRVEFLCGHRALGRARADFQALTEASQVFSSQLDAVPELARAQAESLRALEKTHRALQQELASYQGRELYQRTPPDESGRRRHVERRAAGSIDPLRAIGQSFCSQPNSEYVGLVDNPPALLLATSADSGRDAGKILGAALKTAGGRGGGSARVAQGSAPSREALEAVLGAVLSIL